MTSSTSPTTTTTSQQQLPVIIVGAGPCGLVAALALQQYGVPFKIIERASRSKICSNAGSGFELAPTSVDILKNRLGVDITKFMTYYDGMRMVTTEGKVLRTATLPMDYEGGAVNRSDMQNHLLEILFPSPSDEEGILFCGSGIDSYQENEAEKTVTAKLTSGESITGCVLLACDGIMSRCRAVLHGGYDANQDWETNTKRGNRMDPLHFCNAMVYWGKTSAPVGSDLYNEFSKVQQVGGIDKCVALVGFPTKKAPAGFFCVPSKNKTMLNWAFTIQSDARQVSKNNDGSDLTRRGGGVLSQDEKKRLFDFTSHGKDSESIVKGIKDYPLLEKMIANTPAEDITEAGLYDREKLNLPYTSDSKLVALLGDAAHPQTPYQGQGVNMAISDAYVYATNIAVALHTQSKSLQEAVSDCDTDRRRKQVNSVVKGARMFCDMAISTSFLMIFFMKVYSKLAPVSEFVSQIVKTDKSNREFIKNLDEKHCSLKEQQALRQKAYA